MQTKLRWFLLAGLGVAAIAVVAVLALPGLRGANTENAIQLPEVIITSPQHRSKSPLGSPVVVDVQATAGVPITGLELWVDGQLLGYQPMDGGSKVAVATFVWSPSSAAVHALAARSIGEDGPLAYSDTVHVGVTEMVVDPDMEDTVDHPVPAVLPAAEGVPPVSAPGPTDDIAPAQPVTVPESSLPNSEAGSKPMAPELVAEAQACGAKLSVHDLSADEQGFEVFRQASNSDSWTKVISLASHEGTGWLEYIDSASPGGYTYYVAAYNESGNAPSNMALVNINPEDCDSPGDAGQGVELDLTKLLGDSPADRFYCYQTLNNSAWERLPIDGFFEPSSSRANGGPKAVISLANYSPEGNQTTFQLLLECWGWQGSSLKKLGEFTHNIDLAHLGESDGSLLANAINPIDLGSITSFYPLDGDLGDVEIGAFKGLPLLDPTMSPAAIYVTYDPDECMSHLMPDAQNLLGKILFCTPAPGFDSGSEGGNPQPYLVWNFFKSCSAGYGSPPCKTYEQWLDMAEANNGDVTFSVYDSSSAGLQVHTVSAPGLRNLTIPQVDCSGPRTFWVGMRYSDPDQTVFGPNSNFITIDCPKALPSEIPLDITYDTITFSNLDDGESDPDDVEVYGYLKAWVPGGQTRYMNLAEWDEQDGSCPDESVTWPGSLNDGGLLITDGCTKTFTDGTHSLSTLAVCQGTTKENCAISTWNFQNNVTRVNAYDDAALWLYLVVYDWDDASANDLQCWSIINFEPRSRFEWAKVQNQQFHFIGFDQGNGNCTVHGHIDAVLP